MSTGIKTTYSRQEIRENREAFREWRWTANSIEPDGRVTVLAPAHHAQAMQGFLCRCRQGWFWVINAAELVDTAEREIPHRWHAVTRDLDGDSMRVPTEQELDMGGFRITVDPEPEEYPQQEERETATEETDANDEAKEQLDAGFQSLGQFGFRSDNTQTLKAQAHFMASIAISLRELVMLHKKYDPENMEVIVDPGPELLVADEPIEPTDEKAPGPVAGEDFPFAR